MSRPPHKNLTPIGALPPDLEGGLVPISQILANQPKLFSRPSAIRVRQIDAAAEIRSAPPDDIAYQHSVLCQTSLPYRSTAARRWEARNGHVALLVQAGEAFDPTKNQWVQLPLPFGAMARLILMYLNSEAIRTQNPIIDVEDSLTAFLRQLKDGRAPNGEEIQAFKLQLAALARAKISMAAPDLETEDAIRAPQGDLPIVKFIDLWFPKNPNQRVLWPGTLELSGDYFQDLRRHAVPLDERAVIALSNSPMALDQYAWLAQRLHRVRTDRSYLVTWPNLHAQFGHNYKLIRQFRQAFLKTLANVLAQYPDARVEPDEGGLVLHHSPPPVRPKIVQVPRQTKSTGIL
jgi:hypothetical protein